MDAWELFSSAVEALTLNKLRTGLATLGIVIGIGSVIALISIGQASQQSIQQSIQSLGANTLTIKPGAQTTGKVRQAAGSTDTLSNADATSIQSSAQLTDIAAISPEITQRGQISANGQNENDSVTGVV